MFLIELEIVNDGAEKIITLILNKFTLIWKILALLLLMRKITQLQRNGNRKSLGFTSYLLNSQSKNLRAIEKCICGLRSVEHNMRSIYGQRTIPLLNQTMQSLQSQAC